MTIKDFLKDLDRIRDFDDSRVLILYCNLYIEYFIKNLFKKYSDKEDYSNCLECKRSLYPSFNKQVDFLINKNIVDQSNLHGDLIKIIYRHRNSAAHELSFEEKKIIYEITNHTPKSIKEDDEGLILRAVENSSPWKNLETGSIAIVARLNEELIKIQGGSIDEKLIYEIDRITLDMRPKLINKSDPRFV